jgi:signal transduction histidine kinase
MSRLSPRIRGRLVTLATAVSVALLAWFGYTAIRSWQRSSTALAEHRVKEGIDLFVTALARDMQGAQHSVLLSPDLDGFATDPSHNTMDLVASAFARYPYPESFFAWNSVQDVELVTFFNRRDRPPEWRSDEEGGNRFPVVVSHHARIARALLDRIQVDAALSRAFSVFEVTFGRTRYQVVARLLYRDGLREQLRAVFGFTVNLPWTRDHYFSQLTNQVAHVAGTGVSVTLRTEGRDDEALEGAASQDGLSTQKRFPITFFDPLLVAVDLPKQLSRELLVVEAFTAGDPGLGAANRGATWLLVLGAIAAVTVVLGLVLSLRASSAIMKLAELRADFVAAVTHELKTPIASIRAIGETWLSGRIVDSAAKQVYARLVVQEAKRLSRSVDNLLAFSRITDIGDVYRFDPVPLDAVVKETLEEFAFPLTDEGFQVAVDLPAPPPVIHGDRGGIGLVLVNLVDNAIRYSGPGRWLGIRARQRDESVEVEVSDRGPGIGSDEIARVMQKFYRGRSSSMCSGTGLGLAIVKRIVTAHGGELSIGRNGDVGTTVKATFPCSGGAHEVQNPAR